MQRNFCRIIVMALVTLGRLSRTQMKVTGLRQPIKRKAEIEKIENNTKKIKKVPLSSQVLAEIPEIGFDIAADFNLKICSWNVAGLRALVKKDGFAFIKEEKPDILCLQETKSMEEEVPEEAKLEGYHKYWHCVKGGRNGVALYTTKMPYNVTYGLDIPDYEGRLITAEYTKYFVLCVYVPNAGRKLVNLQKRLEWDAHFQNYVNDLNQKKPVIICGDMNVAHEEIDLANPKSNIKNAGFSKPERDGMTKMLSGGFVDTFRMLYPEKTKAYTFWTYMADARAKNVGWRLDYFIVSDRIKTNIVDNLIRSQVKGSDHCPITLVLNI